MTCNDITCSINYIGEPDGSKFWVDLFVNGTGKTFTGQDGKSKLVCSMLDQIKMYMENSYLPYCSGLATWSNGKKVSRSKYSDRKRGKAMSQLPQIGSFKLQN